MQTEGFFIFIIKKALSWLNLIALLGLYCFLALIMLFVSGEVMPSGIYVRTKAMKTGKYKRTEKHKKCGFQKGHKNGMLGKKHTDTTKQNIKKSLVGHRILDKTKKKMSKKKKGKKWTESRRQAQEKVVRKKKPKTKPIIKHSKEYSPNWNEIRKQIYKRDRWTCQECGRKCKGKNHKDATKKIQCHHVDYNTINNDFSNLITLCASCHMKTNFNRNQWVVYFQNKINGGRQIKTA